MKFKWFQLIHALLREWKEAMSMYDKSLENLLIQDHHLIKKTQIICLTKLNSNELYKIQITTKYKKPKSQSNFEKIFKNSYLDWKIIYLLSHIATVDTSICSFSTNYSMFCFYINCYIDLTFCKIRYAPFVV